MVHRIVWRVGSRGRARLLGRPARRPRASPSSATRTAPALRRPRGPRPRARRRREQRRAAHRRASGDPGRSSHCTASTASAPTAPRPERTARAARALLGARADGRRAFELRGEHRGGWIAFDPAPDEPGRQSAGIVHHVAWGTTTPSRPRWHRAHRRDAACPNTGFIDRHYFHSLYFREPGGVLFELATRSPGSSSTALVEDLGAGSSCRRSSRTGARRSRRA